jgi:hypothetical protein
MEKKLTGYPILENGEPIQFLTPDEKEKLSRADANPFVRISTIDKVIPFIILANGGIVADISANNPKSIAKNLEGIIPASQLSGGGAGFIDVYHGNKTLVLRHVESSIFTKPWLVDDIVSALQDELNIYYPGYRIQSR